LFDILAQFKIAFSHDGSPRCYLQIAKSGYKNGKAHGYLQLTYYPTPEGAKSFGQHHTLFPEPSGIETS